MKSNKMWTKPRELEEAFFKSNPDLIPIKEEIMQACTELNLAFSFQKKLLAAAANNEASADIMVDYMMKSFMLPRPINDELKEKFISSFGDEGEELADKLEGTLRAIAPSSVSPDISLAQATLGLIDEGDVFLGISNGSEDENLATAMMVAKVRGAKCIALTGEKGGRLKEIADITVAVPSNKTDDIREYQAQVLDFLATFVESNYFA